MSISTDWYIKNIHDYANLLKYEYELKEKLDEIHDRLINLSVYMTKEEIEDATEIFEKIMEESVKDNI